MSDIYFKIEKHNKIFNNYKMFLSKRLRKIDHFFGVYVVLFMFVPLLIISALVILISQNNYYKIFSISVIATIIIFNLLYVYVYFNPKAKKETKYKFKNNKVKDFFKWWYNPKLNDKKLKKISKYYSMKEIDSLLYAANIEYEKQKKEGDFKHSEAIFIGVLAILLTIVIDLDLIKDWLKEIFSASELTYSYKVYFFKIVSMLIFLTLIIYKYLMWNIKKIYSTKRDKLKTFIETLSLSKMYSK